MIFETICVGGMRVNCYVLACEEGGAAIIIDPGSDEKKIKKSLDKYKLTAGIVINTHGHYDHIGCDDKFGVPIYAHKDELALLKDSKLNFSAAFDIACEVKSDIKALVDGERIKFDCIELEVIHLPGHSPGGIALRMINPKQDILFTGDTLFSGGVGRADLVGSDESLLYKSIKEKLFVLPESMAIYPGHGPASTIGREMKNLEMA